jgi:hypothetical protein
VSVEIHKYQCSDYWDCPSSLQGTITVTPKYYYSDGATSVASVLILTGSNGVYFTFPAQVTEAYAPAIQIRFKSSNLSTPPSPSHTVNGVSSDLSKGNIITLGITIPLILVMLIIGFFGGRWQKGRQGDNQHSQYPSEVMDQLVQR